MKHLFIAYTTESDDKIVLYDNEVVEVTWSDGNGTVRVEGKTSAAAANGMNLLEMLTGRRAETVDAEPVTETEKKPAKKTASKSAAAKTG